MQVKKKVLKQGLQKGIKLFPKRNLNEEYSITQQQQPSNGSGMVGGVTATTRNSPFASKWSAGSLNNIDN